MLTSSRQPEANGSSGDQNGEGRADCVADDAELAAHHINRSQR